MRSIMKITGLIVISLWIAATALEAQVTGYKDDFNDGLLSGWEMPHPATFSLSESDGVLRIDYTRTASSWEWDNFNFIPAHIIDLAGRPVISLKIKSSVAAELTLKPIFEDGGSDWLQAELPSDNEWHQIVLNLTYEASSLVNRVYFYFDGGSTQSRSGIVFFEDLCFGDSVLTAVDVTGLEKAIGDATALITVFAEGDGEGQVPAGSKTALQAAIDAAVQFAGSDLSAAMQEDVDAAIETLYDACTLLESSASVYGIQTTDPLATRETKYLYANLKNNAENGLLFGMHDATGYGVGWSGDDDRSDVRDVCGDYPAVYSWDVAGIDNFQSPVRPRYRITSAFRRGGINTMCWHQSDPLNRGFYAEDVGFEKIVATLLPGGLHHGEYKQKLHRIARFFKALRGPQGQSVPVIFRPYHEHTGGWFWWGVGHCTRDEFIALWRFTADYLRDSLHVHQLLYAYSPSSTPDPGTYLDRYPGDGYIDILGMDHYFGSTVYAMDQAAFLERLQVAAALSREKNKLAALTEVGQESISTVDWYTRVLLDPLKTDSLACRIAYAAVWRNANTTHHYAPYPGHASVPDFLAFYEDPYTVFEQDLPDMYSTPVEDTFPPELTVLPMSPFTATSRSFVIHIETNERAFLRYSGTDRPYDEMETAFETGQGTRIHETTWTGNHMETRTYYIRASDMLGNRMGESISLTFFIDTLAAPVVWHDRLYPDTGWNTGAAPLGYGDPGTVTSVSEVHTVYFRKRIILPESYSTMGLLVKCHDGAVAYINGHEIGRVNMPDAVTVRYETDALNAGKSSQILIFDGDDLSHLRTGDNVVAVEVHASAVQPPNISFDAQLFNQHRIFTPLGSAWLYMDEGWQPPEYTLGDITGAAHEYDAPNQFALFPNFPNPFNAETKIRYSLSRPGQVRLEIFDTTGRAVACLVCGTQNAGEHEAVFRTHEWPTGIYVYRLRAGQDVISRRMVLIK